MRSVLIDFETTGLTKPSVSDLEKQPHIIEVGLVVVNNGVIVDEYGTLIDPGERITEEITKITGITNEMLEGKPQFADVVGRLDAAFEGCGQLFAHNAEFDCNCLRYELRRLGDAKLYEAFPWPGAIICTVQEFMHEFGHRPKMTELYERKLGRPLAQTHRALDDIKALTEILLHEGML